MTTDSSSGDAPRVITGTDVSALLALNNTHAVELSWQEPAAFTRLLGQACFARTAGDAQALNGYCRFRLYGRCGKTLDENARR